jgi:hypothetical protein
VLSSCLTNLLNKVVFLLPPFSQQPPATPLLK